MAPCFFRSTTPCLRTTLSSSCDSMAVVRKRSFNLNSSKRHRFLPPKSRATQKRSQNTTRLRKMLPRRLKRISLQRSGTRVFRTNWLNGPVRELLRDRRARPNRRQSKKDLYRIQRSQRQKRKKLPLNRRKLPLHREPTHLGFPGKAKCSLRKLRSSNPRALGFMV